MRKLKLKNLQANLLEIKNSLELENKFLASQDIPAPAPSSTPTSSTCTASTRSSTPGTAKSMLSSTSPSPASTPSTCTGSTRSLTQGTAESTLYYQVKSVMRVPR